MYSTQYQQPSMPPSRRPSFWKRKVGCLPMWAIILIAFFICYVVGSTALSHSSTSTTPVTQATATTQPTQQIPTEAPKPKSLDQQINDLVQGSNMSGKNIKSMYNVGGDNYEKVQEDIGDGNLTNSLTVGQIQNDCFSVQKALWTQASTHLSEVEIAITMNVVDQYGNTSNQMVGNCDLKSDTAKQFNWSNLTFDQAWADYDGTFLAPFLTK